MIRKFHKKKKKTQMNIFSLRIRFYKIFLYHLIKYILIIFTSIYTVQLNVWTNVNQLTELSFRYIFSIASLYPIQCIIYYTYKFSFYITVTYICTLIFICMGILYILRLRVKQLLRCWLWTIAKRQKFWLNSRSIVQ